MKQIKIICSLAALIMMVGCGSSSSSSGSTTETHTLTLTVSEADEAGLTVAFRNAVDPSNWLVGCTSLDSDGNKTTKTASYDAVSGKFSVSGIPSGQDTVCHFIEDDVATVAIAFSDETAVGNQRYTSKLTADATAPVAYNTNTGTAVATAASGVSRSSAEDRMNLGTKWSMNCTSVNDLATDEEDTSQSCPEEFQNTSAYLHLVMATDETAELRTGYGAWVSADAYEACGSTEGLDSLPDLWAMDSTSQDQDTDFTWSAPFDSFSASSTSTEILDMIRTDIEGPEMTYSEFAAANPETCTIDDVCATKYYDEVLRTYSRAEGVTVCWPELEFSFAPGPLVTASPWASMVGQTSPLSRYQFMEAFKNGSETYMRGIDSRVISIDDGGDGTVSCNVRDETLIVVDTASIVTPGGDPTGPSISDLPSLITPGGDPSGGIPDPGTEVVGKFIMNSRIASVSGDQDLACQTRLGESSERTRTGFYSRVEMLSWTNPLPTP